VPPRSASGKWIFLSTQLKIDDPTTRMDFSPNRFFSLLGLSRTSPFLFVALD
jgi:hypothetical protein